MNVAPHQECSRFQMISVGLVQFYACGFKTNTNRHQLTLYSGTFFVIHRLNCYPFGQSICFDDFIHFDKKTLSLTALIKFPKGWKVKELYLYKKLQQEKVQSWMIAKRWNKRSDMYAAVMTHWWNWTVLAKRCCSFSHAGYIICLFKIL